MKRIVLSVFLICFGLSGNVSAQSRLCPAGDNTPSNLKYYQKVDSLLLNGGDYSSFAFEIRPSFSAESGCWFDDKDSVLVLRTANQNIYFRNTVKEMALAATEYRCPVSKEAVQTLNKLFISATLSSSFLARPYGGHDGTAYQLFSLGRRFSAECWTPKDKESNCGKLVDILLSLHNAIQNNSPQDIDNLIPTAEALTKQFEDLYPEDLKEKSFWTKEDIMNYI